MSLLELAEPSISSAHIDASAQEIDAGRLYSAADLPGWVVWQELVVWNEQALDVPIDKLEEGYRVLRPIMTELRQIDGSTVLASFREANISMIGENHHDAIDGLRAEILDTFDTLMDEPNLSPAAIAQLEVLAKYIEH